VKQNETLIKQRTKSKNPYLPMDFKNLGKKSEILLNVCDFQKERNPQVNP
jgi:hypothetical protein